MMAGGKGMFAFLQGGKFKAKPSFHILYNTAPFLWYNTVAGVRRIGWSPFAFCGWRKVRALPGRMLGNSQEG